MRPCERKAFVNPRRLVGSNSSEAGFWPISLADYTFCIGNWSSMAKLLLHPQYAHWIG